MGSNPVIPKSDGLIVPFDANLQVLTVRDVLLEKPSAFSCIIILRGYEARIWQKEEGIIP